MITKNDCMSILVKMEDSGINIDKYMRQLIIAKEKDFPLDVLRFIYQNRGLEVSSFYEMLRRNHNKKKSPLYTNIVREETNSAEVVTTLSCLLTQIILYSKKLENSQQFIKAVRAEEISRVLNNYFKTEDIDSCKKLLSLIKSDLLVLEYISGRRELTA